ncbi:Hypothetical predicted protein [Mytilus galloprovincialis]|uniref:Ig-like domain-containing protein n=1 Tax=Mytilus galloprovincialis TaxID=29158 RepID=A0A8B6F2U2_MYTGA|nr:Hypothetical predicted protein [Mytilus galloprovincialis]
MIVVCSYESAEKRGTASLTCLSCSDNLAQPHDCNRVTRCGDHEKCFTDRFVTDDGHYYFKVGCRDIDMCVNPIAVGRRRDITLCSDCCNSTLCNADQHCGSRGINLRGGNLCYNCQTGTLRPDDCNTITLCSSQQSCQIQQISTFIGESRWKSGCQENTKCLSIQKNNTISCKDHCCNSSLCNNHCPRPPSPPKIVNITWTPNTIHFGDDVSLSCITTGNPHPKTEFLFLHSGDVNNLVASPSSGILKITKFSRNNDGLYRCVATNVLGHDQVQFKIDGIL